MGYYTDFELSVNVRSSEVDKDLLEKEIEKLDVFGDGDIDIGYYGNAKWYDYHTDMLLLSSRFHDVLFSLSGYGENSEDIWRVYYLNGAYMDDGIEIIYHDFDESKLVDGNVLDTGQKYQYEY